MNERLIIEAAQILDEMDTRSYDARNKVMYDGRLKNIKKSLTEAKNVAKTDKKEALKKYDEAIKELVKLRKEAEKIPNDNRQVYALVNMLKGLAVAFGTAAASVLISNAALKDKERDIHREYDSRVNDAKIERDKHQSGFGSFVADARYEGDVKMAGFDRDIKIDAVKSAKAAIVAFVSSIGFAVGASASQIKASFNKEDAVTVTADHKVKVSGDAIKDISGSTDYAKVKISVTRTNALVALDKLIRTAKEARARIARA